MSAPRWLDAAAVTKIGEKLALQVEHPTMPLKISGLMLFEDTFSTCEGSATMGSPASSNANEVDYYMRNRVQVCL